MTEPISHIPRNAEEMSRAKEGDLVLITNQEGESIWARFEEDLPNGTIIDKFFVQNLNNHKEILFYAQKRKDHEYDSERGVLMIEGKYNIKPVDNLFYEKRKSELQNVGLWVDNSVVGAQK